MTNTEYAWTAFFGACIVAATMLASVVTVVAVAEQVALPPILVGALPFALEPLAALAGWRWLRHSDRAAMWWTLVAFSCAVTINMAAATTVAGAALHAIFPVAVVGGLHMLMHATAQLADARTAARTAEADRARREQERRERERARLEEPRAKITRTTTRTTTTDTRTDVLELVRGDDARALAATWLEQGRALTEPALVEHLAEELDITPSSARRRLVDARKAVGA